MLPHQPGPPRLISAGGAGKAARRGSKASPPAVHSFFPSCVNSLIHSVILSFIYSIHLCINILIFLVIHPFLFNNSFSIFCVSPSLVVLIFNALMLSCVNYFIDNSLILFNFSNHHYYFFTPSLFFTQSVFRYLFYRLFILLFTHYFVSLYIYSFSFFSIVLLITQLLAYIMILFRQSSSR